MTVSATVQQPSPTQQLSQPPSTREKPIPTNVSTPLPLPPTRTVRITTSVLLPNNEAAATVVLSTAGASGAVSSTLGSGGAGVVVMAGSSVRMMECGLAEDDPKPATFELPIQFAVGGSTMQYFAGTALGHTLLQCVLLGTPLALRRMTSTEWRKEHPAVSYLSMLFCGSHAFFTPAVLGACSTVLANDSDPMAASVAGFSAAVIASIHVIVVLAVHRGPANGLTTRHVRSQHGGGKTKLEFRVASNSTSSDSSSDKSSSSGISSNNSTATSDPLLFCAESTKDILLTLFDGCRIYEKTNHRHYASIETTLFSVIAIISGARPKDNCNYAAFAIGLLAAVHLLYILVIRPFRTKLDRIFTVLNGIVLVVLSMTVAVSVQRRNDTSTARQAWVLKTAEACLWLISVIGFVQLAVQGYWAYHVAQRRRHIQKHSSESDASSDINDDSTVSEVSDENAEPLLVAVEMEHKAQNANRTAHNNPLLEESK